MQRLILPTIALVLLAVGTASAGSVTYSNDPTQFRTTIDWCQFGGCTGSVALVATPSPWVSTSGGLSGNAGLFYSADPLLALQQDVTWLGSFNPGMGLLYNWPGASGSDIAITFDQLVYGAGAYVEPYSSGPFQASIFLFNNVYNITATYTWSIAAGEIGPGPGTALFIGAFSSAPDVYGAIFDVSDQFGNVDFALGQAGVQATPEPATMLLVGVSMLGLGIVRRCKRRSRRSASPPQLSPCDAIGRHGAPRV